MKEMDNWKATPRDNMFLKMSNGAPMSRWLTDGSDHNRNYNFSMRLDNVPTILCYFLVAISSLKLSEHVYGIKHMFTLKNDTFSLLGQPNRASSTVINFSEKIARRLLSRF